MDIEIAILNNIVALALFAGAFFVGRRHERTKYDHESLRRLDQGERERLVLLWEPLSDCVLASVGLDSPLVLLNEGETLCDAQREKLARANLAGRLFMRGFHAARPLLPEPIYRGCERISALGWEALSDAADRVGGNAPPEDRKERRQERALRVEELRELQEYVYFEIRNHMALPLRERQRIATEGANAEIVHKWRGKI